MLHLFTDGSVHAQLKIGYGSYLVLSSLDRSIEAIPIHTKHFEKTSSTKLELQTLLWALSEIQLTPQNTLTIYTDSTAITNLPSRRAKLETADYYSKNGKRLNNYKLYQEFYDVFDRINFTIEKVQGHQPTCQKTDVEKVFTLLDKASRKALREKVLNLSSTSSRQL